jgi:hypothetical protein
MGKPGEKREEGMLDCTLDQRGVHK